MSVSPNHSPAFPARRGNPLKIARWVYFFFFAGIGFTTVFLNVYYHQIGLSGVQIGVINMVVPLVAILSMPVWGILGDKFGIVRRLLMISAFGSGVAMLAVSTTRIFGLILVLMALFSLFNSPFNGLLDALTLGFLHGQQENYGRIRIWGSVGFIITSMIFGRIIELVGPKALFYSYTALMFIVVVVLYFLPARRAAMPAGLQIDLSIFIREPGWTVFFGSLFFLGVVLIGMYTFIGIHIQDLGGNQAEAGWAYGLGAISEMPVMMFGGQIVQKFGPRRMLLTAYLLYAVRMIFYSLAPGPLWIVAIGLMHSITFALYWIASVSYTDRLAADHMKATAHNMRLTVIFAANLFGSLMSGVLYDKIGGKGLFLVLAGFALVAFLLMLFSRSIRSEQPARTPVPADS